MITLHIFPFFPPLTVGSLVQVALQVKAAIAIETMNWSKEKSSRTPTIPSVRLWNEDQDHQNTHLFYLFIFFALLCYIFLLLFYSIDCLFFSFAKVTINTKFILLWELYCGIYNRCNHHSSSSSFETAQAPNPGTAGWRRFLPLWCWKYSSPVHSSPER